MCSRSNDSDVADIPQSHGFANAVYDPHASPNFNGWELGGYSESEMRLSECIGVATRIQVS